MTRVSLRGKAGIRSMQDVDFTQKQWDGRPHPKRHQRAKVELRVNHFTDGSAQPIASSGAFD